LSRSAGEKTVRHGSDYMTGGDKITVELAVKAADMYDVESKSINSKKKKNIYMEPSALRRDPVFEVGAQVLVSVQKTEDGGGLAWTGPYTVDSRSLNGMYQLRNNNDEIQEQPVESLKAFCLDAFN
jgi:hypothetical protein